MPELPQIEITRQRLDPKVLRRPIHSVITLDERALKDTDADTLRQGLEGAELTGIARFGHFLLLEVARERVLLVSLSGSAEIQQVRPQEDPPRNSRLAVRFHDAGGLAITDARAGTWLRLLADENALPDLGSFGPDALNGELDPEAWRASLQGRRAQIKGLLLDATLVAGIGPSVADEILFQARIRPDRKAADLSDEEIDRLREMVSRTLDKAVRCQARPEQLPKSFLGRTLAEGSELCPKCEASLDKRKIQGRTTYFCPTCQQ